MKRYTPQSCMHTTISGPSYSADHEPLPAAFLVVQTSLSTSYIYSRLESGHKKVQEHLDRRLNKLDVYERDKSRLFANAT